MTKKTKPLSDEETRIARLERLADTMIETAENAADPEIQSTTARSALMVVGELRKAKKAARDEDGEMTIARVIEWARRLPAADRAQLTRSVASLHSEAGKSGLA